MSAIRSYYGKNGYIFEAENLNDFVEKIKIFNKKNCLEMGQESLKRIENFNFVKICTALEHIVING